MVSTTHAAIVFVLAAVITLVCGIVLEASGSAIASQIGMTGVLFGATVLARIIHRTARNRPRPPNTWARDFIAKNFIKQPIRIVANDINGLALIVHFS